jgi:succinate dehydrogenase/fumarate reductase flavoprotein subunit
MKFFNRAGKATWIGFYANKTGESVGPFVSAPSKELGDITGDIWQDVFKYQFMKGQPVFMNCTLTSQEDLDYMCWALRHEGNGATLNHMADEGIDLKKHLIEFYQFEPFLIGRGVDIDINGAATVQGLYAAGDETGNFRGDIAGAAVYGRIAGEHTAEYAKLNDHAPAADAADFIKQKTADYSELFKRPVDVANPSWYEANLALQQIMTDYAGVEVRSETLYNTGLTYLRRLRDKAEKTMACGNSHEFLRCLETLDLMLVGELLMLSGLERKEVRGKHNRVDFPYTNPLNNDRYVRVTKKGDKPAVDWRNRN